MNPFFAQKAHVLFVNSNVGLLKRLPSRFTSVRTIESIVTQNRRKTLVEAINDQNEQYKKMFRWRLINGTECKIREDLTNITCSTVVADKAREIGWEKTFVSLTKPVPQHQFTIIPIDIARDEDLEVCITVKVSQDAQVNPRNCTRIFGPYKPYIGSVTETKVKRPMLC